MTINESPSGNVFALSPIIYHISDPAYASADFEYVLDVYMWSGDKVTDAPAGGATPNFQLTKVPDSNNAAVFDVSFLVRSSLVPQEVNDYIFTTDTFVADSSSNHTKWLQVRASYWTDGSTKQNTTSSTTQLAHRGFTLHDDADGVNGNHSDRATFAHAINDLFIPDGVPFSVSVNTGAIKAVDVKQNNGSGVTYPLETPTDVDNTINTQKFITIVVDDLNTSTLGGGYLRRVTDDSGSYESQSCLSNYLDAVTFVEITTRTSSATDKTWRLNVVCEPKHSPKFLCFLNRFGAWDFLPVTLLESKGISVERSEYRNNYLTTSASSPFASYDSSRPVHRVNEVKGQNTMTFNTGYQPEEVFTLIEDLMMSERVTLISSTKATPLKIVEDSVSKQLHIKEKLVNYTIQCEVAHPFKNVMSI